MLVSSSLLLLLSGAVVTALDVQPVRQALNEVLSSLTQAKSESYRFHVKQKRVHRAEQKQCRVSLRQVSAQQTKLQRKRAENAHRLTALAQEIAAQEKDLERRDAAILAEEQAIKRAEREAGIAGRKAERGLREAKLRMEKLVEAVEVSNLQGGC